MTLKQKAIQLNNLLIREGNPSLIFFIIMEIIKTKALEWWNTLPNKDKYEVCIKHNSLILKKKLSQLTEKEIEEIYLKYK